MRSSMLSGGVLHNLFEFLKVYRIDRCNGSEGVTTEDVVVCFDEDNEKVACLGTVKYVGRKTLCEDHPDGGFGEVFVLPFNKARVKKGTPFNRK